MTYRRAIRLSIWVHAAFALLLWRMDLSANRARVETVQREAAHRHEAEFQRSASASYTDRLRRMNELVQRLDQATRERDDTRPDAAPRNKETPPANPPELDSASEQAKPTAAADQPASAQPRDPLARLWEQSREEHAALRERFVNERAQRLAELKRIDPAEARRQVDSQAGDPLEGRPDAPSAPAEAAADIAALHADGQRMLREIVRQAAKQGQGLTQDSAREAALLGAGGGQQSGSGEAVADHTPLFVSQHNGRDTRMESLADRQRAVAEQNRELINRFQLGRARVRFTRRLGGTEAGTARWVAPDAWYIIGPFANPWRSQIDTAFPPELEIDRDALYEGRDGRIIAWKYVRTRKIGVMPPDMVDYAIYYAFTEIQCATAMDCWLAIGSDDYSKVWVNDMLIWSGVKREKIWEPTEGFRRVHLERGVNKILVRLENGINSGEFSVLIALD